MSNSSCRTRLSQIRKGKMTKRKLSKKSTLGTGRSKGKRRTCP